MLQLDGQNRKEIRQKVITKNRKGGKFMYTNHKNCPCPSKTRAYLKPTTAAMAEGCNSMKNYSNNCTSTIFQRNKILEYLRIKPLTAIAAITELGMMHRVASYILLAGGANHE